MRVSAERSARSLLVTAVGAWALAGASAALAQTAGTTSPVTGTQVNTVAGAQALVGNGKLVEARATLTAIAADAKSSAEERAAAASMLAGVDKRLASMDANEVSLQKSEWMLRTGDFKGARHQAFAVATNSKASSETQARAARLLKQAESAIGNAAALADEQPGTKPDEKKPAPIDLPDMPKLPAKPADPYFPPQPKQPEQPAPAAPAPQQGAQPAKGDQPGNAPAPSADAMNMMAFKANAQANIAEGDAAYADSRYAEAARLYTKALASRAYLSPEEIAGAEKKLAEANVRMGGAGAGSLQDQVSQAYDIVRGKTTAEFTNAIAQAQRAMKAGDMARAREQAAAARLTADRGRAYFSQAEYDAMDKQVLDLNRAIETAGEKQRVDTMRQDEQNARTRAEQAQKDIAAERARKIDEGLRRARALQKERKYNEALEVANNVLFLDPNNPTAELLRDMLTELRTFQVRDQKQRRTEDGMLQLRLDNIEATRPPIGIIEYPDDWPRISMLRTGAGGFFETPENRRADAAMSKMIPAKFEKNALINALAYVSRTAGVPMDIDWRSLEQIGADQATPVSMDLGDQPAKVVLEKILKQISKDRVNKADTAINNGIVTVGSADTIRRQTVTVTYPIADMLLFAPDYNDVPVLDLESKVGNKKKSVDAFKAERKNVPDKKERIRQIISVIEQGVDPDSWKENGGDIGSVTELNGLLVITNTARNHREITGLLSKLREIRQTQISVESRFLLVSQDFFEQVNFDLDVYFNANSSQVRAARGFDPNIIPSDLFDPGTGRLRRSLDSDRYAAGGSFTPTVIPPGQLTRGVQNTTPPQNYSPIGVTQNGDLARFLVQADSFTGQLLNQAPAMGISGTYLDDVQVDFLIKATQADNRTVTLTAPRLTFTNGQIANVVVGTQRAYVGDLDPVTGSGSVAFDPVPATLTEGVTLLVEGVASADRRYVTMNIETSIAALQALDTFTQQAQAGGTGLGGGGGAPVIGTFQLPTLQVTRVNTTVLVPDQGTIMLGGQRVTEEVELETGVPVLSKIPVLNRFFTNRVQSRRDRSLLILMKPTILIQSEEEEKSFPGLNDALRNANQ